jgi:hypothetical protein
MTKHRIRTSVIAITLAICAGLFPLVVGPRRAAGGDAFNQGNIYGSICAYAMDALPDSNARLGSCLTCVSEMCYNKFLKYFEDPDTPMDFYDIADQDEADCYKGGKDICDHRHKPPPKPKPVPVPDPVPVPVPKPWYQCTWDSVWGWVCDHMPDPRPKCKCRQWGRLGGCEECFGEPPPLFPGPTWGPMPLPRPGPIRMPGPVRFPIGVRPLPVPL